MLVITTLHTHIAKGNNIIILLSLNFSWIFSKCTPQNYKFICEIKKRTCLGIYRNSHINYFVPLSILSGSQQTAHWCSSLVKKACTLFCPSILYLLRIELTLNSLYSVKALFVSTSHCLLAVSILLFLMPSNYFIRLLLSPVLSLDDRSSKTSICHLTYLSFFNLEVIEIVLHLRFFKTAII